MKIKTHKGASKRIKVRGKGKSLKLTFDKAAKRHLLVNKSKGQKSETRTVVAPSNLRAMKKLLQK